MATAARLVAFCQSCWRPVDVPSRFCTDSPHPVVEEDEPQPCPRDYVLVHATPPTRVRSGYHPLIHIANTESLSTLARGVRTATGVLTLCGVKVGRQWYFQPRWTEHPNRPKTPTWVTCPKCLAAWKKLKPYEWE